MVHIRWEALKQRSRRGALLSNASSTSSFNLKKVSRGSKIKKSDALAPNMNVRLNPLLRAAGALPPTSTSVETVQQQLSLPKGNTAIPYPPPPPSSEGGSSVSTPGSSGSLPGPPSNESASIQMLDSVASWGSSEVRTGGFRTDPLGSGEIRIAEAREEEREEVRFHIEEAICNKPFNKDVLEHHKDILVPPTSSSPCGC